MHSSRLYFNNIGSICTEDSLRLGNGLSALLLLTRAAKSSTDVSRLTGCISIIIVHVSQEYIFTCPTSLSVVTMGFTK